MPAILLLDNTILSNFGLVRRPDVLFDLWGTLMVTTRSVMNEYQNGVLSRSLTLHAWDKVPVIEPTADEIVFAGQLPGELGDGERFCLAIAIPRQGWIASDDLKARQVAKQYGIGVTGTIGAFEEALKQQILDLRTANTLLKKMITAGYRSPVKDLGKV